MLHLAIAAGLILGLIVGLAAAATGNEALAAIARGSAPRFSPRSPDLSHSAHCS